MKKLDKVSGYWHGKLDDDAVFVAGEEVFFPELLKAAHKSGKILEVGIGKGRMVKILLGQGVKADFYGCDITDNVKGLTARCVKGDARSLPFPDDTFDLVYSLGVVEHFPETRVSVLEHARVLKKNGILVITTPHLSFFTPLRYILYLLKDRREGSFEEICGRNIRLATMKGYFMDANLSIKKCGTCGLFGLKKILKSKRLHSLGSNIFIGASLYVIGAKE